MGVEARLVLYARDAGVAESAARAAFARMERVNQALSDYLVEGEVARLERRAGRGSTGASSDLLAALDRSLAVARESGGAFDVTVGPLVRLWRDSRRTGRRPAAGAVAAARSRVGFEKVVVDHTTRSISLAIEGMALDFGGIGKGYAADRALDVLRAYGAGAALIDFGGDLTLGDAPPGRSGWRVRSGCGVTDRVHEIANAAIATSGDTEQHVVIDGVRYSHVLDPRAGEPLRDAPCVSVIAQDGATADALASAVSVLGAFEGRALARRLGATAFVDDPRFRPLFDGRTLDAFDVEPRDAHDTSWTIEDGAVVGRVGSDRDASLATRAAFSDFELSIDVAAVRPTDFDVIVRAAEAGAGVPVSRCAAIGWARGWNHLDVRVTGTEPFVETWWNGARVIEDGRTDGTTSAARSGSIALRIPGTAAGVARAVRFRGLHVRVLPTVAATERRQDS